MRETQNADKPRIIFFGNERLVTGLKTAEPLALKNLISAGYPVEAIVSRGNQEIEDLATKQDIKLLSPKNQTELQDMVGPIEAELGVLVAFGEIMPKEVIDKFKH